MNKLLITTTAIVALAAVSASAQNFTGSYIGASVGMTDVDSPDLEALSFNFIDSAGDGTQFGIHAGFDYQFTNNFVLGIEAAYTAGEVDHDINGLLNAFHTDNYVDLKLKAGYALNPSLMAYVVGGYSAAVASIEDGASNISLEGLDGSNFGIGMDYMINSNFSIGAEILRRNLDFTNTSIAIDDYDTTSFALRAAYRF